MGFNLAFKGLNYVTSHSKMPYNRTSQWSDQHLGGPWFKSGHWASQQIFCLCLFFVPTD